jgi:hypothetical protein
MTFDPADYFTHKSPCEGRDGATVTEDQHYGRHAYLIACNAGCGQRHIPAETIRTAPHYGSPYRCRVHHAQRVNAKGRGCRPCAREAAESAAARANKRRTRTQEAATQEVAP